MRSTGGAGRPHARSRPNLVVLRRLLLRRGPAAVLSVGQRLLHIAEDIGRAFRVTRRCSVSNAIEIEHEHRRHSARAASRTAGASSPTRWRTGRSLRPPRRTDLPTPSRRDTSWPSRRTASRGRRARAPEPGGPAQCVETAARRQTCRHERRSCRTPLPRCRRRQRFPVGGHRSHRSRCLVARPECGQVLAPRHRRPLLDDVDNALQDRWQTIDADTNVPPPRISPSALRNAVVGHPPSV